MPSDLDLLLTGFGMQIRARPCSALKVIQRILKSIPCLYLAVSAGTSQCWGDVTPMSGLS